MSIEFRLNGALLPYQSVRLTGGATGGGVAGLPSSAWYGEPMTAGITIDDPNGSITIQGWEVFTVDESACVGKTRIFTGWIYAKNISRGPYRNSAGRIWDCDIIDQNACISFEIYRANSAKRPAETDLARIAFCLGSAPMAGTPVVAGSLTNLTDNPRNLQEADHTRQYPVELLTSTAGRAGKYFYVFWNQTTARLELYYDLATAFPSATISISNVLADVTSPTGGTVFAPFIDATLNRDPTNVFTGELLDYVGGAVYQRRQATIDALSPTPLSPINFLRDFHRTSDQIGLATTANAVVVADLEQFANEEDTINVMVQLPASRVNHVQAGEKINVKFSHLPGYSTTQAVNVIRRTVVPTDGMDALYDVHLELSNKVKIRDVDGGPPGVFPQRDECDFGTVSLVQSAHAHTALSGGNINGASWPAPPTPGNLIVCGWLTTGTANAVTGMNGGWNLVPDSESFVGTGGAGGQVSVFYKIASDSEATQVVSASGDNTLSGPSQDESMCYLLEYSGVDTYDVVATFNTDAAGTNQLGGSITPTSGKVAIVVTFGEMNSSANGPITPSAGMTELYEENSTHDGSNPVRWVGYRLIDGTTGSYAGGGTFPSTPPSIAVETSFYCSGGQEFTCPAAGQWTEWAFLADGDGTTTLFTVPCPYADETLEVQVDGQNILLGLTETDPAAGTFTLDFAPLGAQGDAPAEQVWVRYQGR